jgi:hypothetical protein
LGGPTVEYWSNTSGSPEVESTLRRYCAVLGTTLAGVVALTYRPKERS